jgi:hypothetical protein
MGARKWTIQEDAFFLEECKKRDAFSRNSRGWFLSTLTPAVHKVAELMTSKFNVERDAKALSNRWNTIKKQYDDNTGLAYDTIMQQLALAETHNQIVADDTLREVDMMLIDPKAFRRYLADMSPEEAMVKAQIA